MPLRIQSLVRLSHMVIILFVSRHIFNFLRNHRIRRIAVIDLAVRSLDKAILINPCICCKGVDQTDIRTFRRLDRTHSSIMRIMNVSNLESGAVSGQTARSQGRQTSLMRQLAQRIILIHEL